MNPVALGWLLWTAQGVFCLTAVVVIVQAARFAPKARYFVAGATLLLSAAASWLLVSWWPLVACLLVLSTFSPWIDIPSAGSVRR